MIAQLRQQLAVLQADQTTELSAKLAKQQVTHVNALPVTFHGCVGAIPLPLCILKRYLLLFCEKSLLLTVCLVCLVWSVWNVVWFGCLCVLWMLSGSQGWPTSHIRVCCDLRTVFCAIIFREISVWSVFAIRWGFCLAAVWGVLGVGAATQAHGI
jgi:hypothetical protein